MLNMTVGAANRAGGYGRYLSGQTIAAWSPEVKTLALGADVAGGITDYDAALEQVIEMERTEVHDNLRTHLDGLRLAFEAVGQFFYMDTVDRLIRSIDTSDFNVHIDGLDLALQARNETSYLTALTEIRHLHDDLTDERLLVDRALDRLAYATWRAEEHRPSAEPTGMQYRQDTDPRLAALLRFDPQTQPSLKAVTNLMSAKTAQGRPVPGHRILSNGFIDFTWSAGKDASIAWAFANPTEKALIFAAHTAAVDLAMRRIEQDIGTVRRGFHDRFPPQPGHITWIQFHHEVARPTPGYSGDPLLHTHVVVPNLVLSRTTDDVGCLSSYGIASRFMDYRRLYFREFSQRLRSLGIEITYNDRIPDVRIPTIPDDVAKVFSKRTSEAELVARQQAAKLGIDYNKMTELQIASSLRRAAADTRRSKDTGTADTDSWQKQVEHLGWTWTHAISRALQRTISLGLNQEEGLGVRRVRFEEDGYGLRQSR